MIKWLKGVPSKVIALGVAMMMMVCMAQPASAASKIVSGKDSKYSYSDMKKDIRQLKKKYNDRIKVATAGKTADKRSIYSITIGNENAKKKVLVVAGMHAREYINCQVAMSIVERYCKKYNKGKDKGKKYKDILNKTAIVFVPMINPDGVTIAQYGPKKINSSKLRKIIRRTNRSGGYRNWKANARAVDINRNFSSGWSHGVKRHPHSEGYCGKRSFSEKETKTFKKLVKQLKPKAVINLHSKGKIVYWGYKGSKVRKNEMKLTRIVFSQTHYGSVCENRVGGYGDAEHWLKSKKIPYVCIENGSGGVPVSHGQFRSILKKNVNIPIKAAHVF